jgi:hypothetical protein
MQATKDSFYITLRDRLAEIDPTLTIEIDGATRPAIVVLENEPTHPVTLEDNVFYIEWGGVRSVHPESSTLAAMDCVITYSAAGQVETGGVSRGRKLAALDADLLAICMPGQTHKYDYSSGTPVELGSYIFWLAPEIKPGKTDPLRVTRNAYLTIFFYPEVNQQ